MSYYLPLSYWEQEKYLGKADVAIIGGGIVGMNAALRLKETNKDLKITVLERSSLGTAASSRNAGFACYSSPSEILGDLQSLTTEEVYQLIKRRVDGLALLKNIVGVEALKYAKTGGHEVFIDSRKLELHLDQLNSLNRMVGDIDPNLKFYLSEDTRGLKNIKGVISNDWEGQIHPGNMSAELRRQCNVREINVLTNVKVDSIEEDRDFIIRSGSLSIHASKVIICNNAFAKDFVEIETIAGRNQVILTSRIRDLPIFGCYHYDKGFVYFRNVKDRVLIGGGRNIAQDEESTKHFGQTDHIKEYLLNILKKHILVDRSYKIDYEWSGILGFNKTKKPIVKEISSGKFVAVGLGGMGVAIGALVGKEVADLLLQS